METSLTRRNLEQSLECTSLSDLVKQTAEVVMLLIDTSGSMDAPLANGQRAIDALRTVVADIRSQGHVPLIAFGGPYDAQVRFVDDVPEPDGGTPLHLAIPFAKQYGATRLVVISDGMPDLTEQSLQEARLFGGRIDVCFVGNDHGYLGGKTFLEELARLTGGVEFQGDLTDPKQLTGKIVLLLEGDVPEKPTLQGEGFATVDTDDDEEDDEEEDDDEA